MENIGEEFGREHIPPQVVGEKMDAVEKRSFKEDVEAMGFFELVRYRLLDVNHWSSLAGNGMAKFQLTDSSGNAVERLAQQGDHFKIDIPGPGSIIGNGYDWVEVESIIEERAPEMEMLTLSVRPAANPLSKNGDTAHFLTEQATSTFQVKRIGQDIYAGEHGRNEQANTYTTDAIENIRNMLVGWAATLGFSYPQWKSLVKGLLQDSP